jgi:UDP-N-acetylmuramate--alanine ligase
MQDVIDAYSEYANNAEKMVIACGDDPYTRMLELNKPIFYYGIDEDNDIVAKNIEYSSDGVEFDVFVEENYYGHFDLPFYGKHMLLNTLAVISVCYYERLDAKDVAKNLKTFMGAERRFEETTIGNTVLVDDYAHHPTEVKAVIKAARQKYPNKKIVAVFRPHTFSRTEAFADDLAKVLGLADKAFLLDIFPSREKQEDYPGVTSKMIVDNIPGAEMLDDDNWDKLKDYKDAVILFLSPKQIKNIMDKLEEYLSN